MTHITQDNAEGRTREEVFSSSSKLWLEDASKGAKDSLLVFPKKDFHVTVNMRNEDGEVVTYEMMEIRERIGGTFFIKKRGYRNSTIQRFPVGAFVNILNT